MEEVNVERVTNVLRGLSRSDDCESFVYFVGYRDYLEGVKCPNPAYSKFYLMGQEDAKGDLEFAKG